MNEIQPCIWNWRFKNENSIYDALAERKNQLNKLLINKT